MNLKEKLVYFKFFGILYLQCTINEPWLALVTQVYINDSQSCSPEERAYRDLI